MNILELNLLIITISALILLGLTRNKIAKRFFLATSIIIMGAINGLRYPLVGTDMGRYSRHFVNIGQMTNLRDFLEYDQEIGYKLFQWIIFQIFGEFQYFIIIYSLLIFSLFGYFIWKYSRNYYLSIILFLALEFYDFTFSGMRQSLAIAIGIYSYHYAMEKKPLKFILVCLVASTFHITAIVLLPIYFIFNYKITKKFIIFIVPFFSLYYLGRINIGKIFNLIYYDSTETTYVSSGGFSGMAIFLILIVLIGFIFESPLSKKISKLSNGSINTIILSVFVQVISAFAFSFTRLNYYFLIILIVYIPELLNIRNSKGIYFEKKLEMVLKAIMTVIILIYFINSYLTSLSGEISNALPYFFFWEV